MRFKIISDLHVDVNRNIVKQMKFDSNAFYLIAGDVSGDRFTTEDFLKGKGIKGAFIEGNHFGYNVVTYDANDTKTLSIEYLKDKFNGDSPIKFLENKMIEINDCVVVGCTLYTDFKLFGDPILYGNVAMQGMNDFRYVYVQDEDKHCRRVQAEDYEKWFAKSIEFIDYVCEQKPNSKIVVLTHHAPSIQSISGEYVTDSLTPAYASNLEQFILDRPQIKAWCHGHTHRPSDYYIGETHIVNNPFGYENENDMNLDTFLGVDLDV